MTDRRPATVQAGGAVLTLGTWTGFLVVAIAALYALGGALAPPPLTDPGGFGDWLDQRQPADAAFAVLRLVALGLAWYLLLVTVAGAVARVTGWRSLVRALDAVTVPAVRRLVAGAAGASLAAAALTGAGGAALAEGQAAPPSAPAAETIRRLPDAAPGTAPPAPLPAPPPPVVDPGDTGGQETAGTLPVMRRLPTTAPDAAPDPDPDPGTPSTLGPTGTVPVIRRLPPATSDRPPGPATDAPTTTAPASPAPSTTPFSAPPRPAARATTGSPEPATSGAPTGAGLHRTWQVAPGDHFWAVAERVLAEAWQRPPTDDEVKPYWRAVVDANAAILRDPGNPDLLFPGQVIAVPAPPARPGG